MTKPQQAVLLCGGLGTRLRPLTNTIPKPMAPIHDQKPFLHYLLEQLTEKGIRRFVLLVGYLPDVIIDYFGDGKQFGWDINYSQGPVEWDTGRRIWEARDLLDERFVLLYSDNFASFPFDEMWQQHQKNRAMISLLLSHKTPGNVAVGKDGILETYDRNRQNSLPFVELGYMLIEREPMLSAYMDIFGTPDFSFSRVLEYFADKGTISGRILNTPYYSVSDPKRLELTRQYLSPSKIVLLDRDGTLHERAPRGEYVSKWENVVMLPQAVDGLKILSEKGYKFVVISNQAGIGRGVISREDVDSLNESMREYFWSIGIEILAFYVCPHHWEDNCECRKPKPGLFYKCATDYNLRLEKILYVGDDPRDCQAAEEAGTRCLYVGDPEELRESAYAGEKTYSGILDAVDDIRLAYEKN
jgi:histidinol-phosphate phosphatase family protein